MATVAVLSIGVRANAKQFNAGIGGVIKKIGGLRTVVAGLAGGALAVMGKRQLELTDQLGKTASKLGMTAEEYSRLEFAASQAGVASTMFATATQRLTRRLAEVASTGKGTALEALQTLGLSAQELMALRPEARMMKLAEAFGQVGNQGERVRLAFKLFDTEGVNMVNLLGQGADAMQEMFTEADKLGITVSQLDTSRAAMFVDLTDKLKRVIQAVVRRVAVGMVPVMVAVGEQFLEWIKSSGDWGLTLSNWIGAIIDAFAELGRVSDFVGGIWRGLQAIMANIVGWLSKAGAAVAGLFSEDVRQLLDEVAKAEFDLADELWSKSEDNFRRSFEPVNETAETIRKTFDDVARRAREIADNSAKAAMELGAATDPDVFGSPKRSSASPAMAAVERGSAAAMDVISRVLMGDPDKVQKDQLSQLVGINQGVREFVQLFDRKMLEAGF